MDYENGESGAETLMWSWHKWKLFFEHSVSFSQDAVHVIAGVIILIAVALLLRKPLSSWWPWLAALLFTCINEFIDLWVERWPEPAMQYGEALKDLMLTMFLPTALLLSARLLPRS